VSATFHLTGMPLQSHVSAAKAAVDALMGSVALEYGPFGVTANTVQPGAIAGTEGMERLASGAYMAQAAATATIPSGRWGTVRDVADATVFLFSDAGNYVNGTNLVCDGAGWRRHGGLAVGLDPNSKQAIPRLLSFLLDSSSLGNPMGMLGSQQQCRTPTSCSRASLASPSRGARRQRFHRSCKDVLDHLGAYRCAYPTYSYRLPCWDLSISLIGLIMMLWGNVKRYIYIYIYMQGRQTPGGAKCYDFIPGFVSVSTTAGVG
jgi:hypothetical protein